MELAAVPAWGVAARLLQGMELAAVPAWGVAASRLLQGMELAADTARGRLHRVLSKSRRQRSVFACVWVSLVAFPNKERR